MPSFLQFMNLNLVSWGTDVTMEFKWINGNWNASTETVTKNSINIVALYNVMASKYIVNFRLDLMASK